MSYYWGGCFYWLKVFSKNIQEMADAVSCLIPKITDIIHTYEHVYLSMAQFFWSVYSEIGCFFREKKKRKNIRPVGSLYKYFHGHFNHFYYFFKMGWYKIPFLPFPIFDSFLNFLCKKFTVSCLLTCRLYALRTVNERQKVHVCTNKI